MRKHKSVVAVLLAVMMIFTFMPTMAFANVEPQDGRSAAVGSWEKDYSGVTAKNTYYSARRSVVADGNGLLVAKLDDSDYASAALANVPWVDDVYFYDLTGASLALKGTYNQDEFNALFNSSGKMNSPKLNIEVPSYVYGYSTLTPKKYEGVSLTGWTITVEKPESYVKDSETDQTVTLTAEITSNGADGTSAHPYRVDTTVISKSVVVKGKAPAITSVKFYDAADDTDVFFTGSDSDKTATVSFRYDGTDHKVANNDVTGYTVAYSVLNKSTGQYDAVSECPTVKNVGDTKKVKATVSWTETTPITGGTATITHKTTTTFEMSVTAATAPKFGFDPNGNYSYNSGNYGYNAETGYVAADFVVVDPAYTEPSGPSSATTRKINAANKAAVEANTDELKAFFGDIFTIKTTTQKASPNYEFLAIERKTSSDIDTKAFEALKKKYEVLLKNFNLYNEQNLYAWTNNRITSGADKASVYIKPAAVDTEVEFTSAPTSKVYKGKKTTKAGKLKKDQNFTVKAVSNDGATVAYKLINANSPKISIDKNTGKITVKKGAKGTYKIKVKAYVPGNSIIASETQAITIKIKK